MSKVKLIWVTPDAEALLAYIARVSNPLNQDNPNFEKLFKHMMENGHASPFQMVNMCIEVNTTRDIGRQMLRHWSMMPQEFSQRYQTVTELGDFELREFRLQDLKNRQASIEVEEDDPRAVEWAERQARLVDLVKESYKWCLENGGAKEVARVVLPEGLTPTRMYFNAPIRSWIFYLRSRIDISTQKEHRLIANQILELFKQVVPTVYGAFFTE